MPTPSPPPPADPRRPDDWHLHLRDGPAMAAVLAATAARLRESNRHAKPEAAGDDDGAGARLPRTHPRRAARRLALRAADDALPHRQHAARRKSRRRRRRASSTRSSTTRRARRRTRTPASPRSSASTPRSRRWRSTASCCRCTAKSPMPTSTCSIASACSSSARSTRIVRDFPALQDRARAHHDARRPPRSSRAAPPNVAATITPQHLLYSRNALFAGGVRPHLYCLPILKRETHRQALRRRGDVGQPEVLPRHRLRAACARTRRRTRAAARAAIRRRSRSRCTPRRSRTPGRSTGSKASRATSAPISTACRATATK